MAVRYETNILLLLLSYTISNSSVCLPPSKFREEKWRPQCPILTNIFPADPEVDHVLEELHGITHKFNAPIILNRKRAFLLKRGNETLLPDMQHHSYVQDMAKEISKHESISVLQNTIKPHTTFPFLMRRRQLIKKSRIRIVRFFT